MKLPKFLSITLPIRRWQLLSGASLLAVVIVGAHGAPYAAVAPGPAPDLKAAIEHVAKPSDLDSSFTSSGGWHATTIDATPLTWAGLAWCKIRSCAVYPLLSNNAAKAQASQQMDESISTARDVATAWTKGTATHEPDLNVNLGQVGGPSAGLLLTLSFIDARTDGDLTGGQVIAGTGTIDPDGTVGPVGGVQFKVAGALAAGAQVFFAPAGTEAEQATAAADGKLQVVPVASVKDAVGWLCAHAGASPVCTSGAPTP